MLKQDELERIVVKSQTSRINVYREYCQNVFLSLLYMQKAADQILFKGGTALKIVYQSPRYSEDLDFTFIDVSDRKFEDMLLAVSEALQKNNLVNQITEAKKTTGGYLAKLKIDLYREEVTILIQGSRRKREATKANIQLVKNDYIPQYTALLLPEAELVMEKIQAALTRAKPRDFFDVYFLLRQGLVPVELRGELVKLGEVVGGKGVNFTELLNFLPASMAVLVKSFKDSFITEIDKFR